jgi:predicted protein tyrosine phosphatase
LIQVSIHKHLFYNDILTINLNLLFSFKRSKKLSHIHVCALSKINENLERTGATHLMSLIGHKFDLVRPERIQPENYLRVKVSDIVPQEDGSRTPEHQRDGHILTEHTHVHDIINFVREWERQTPMLIHCYAGVSRSTAAAYIAMLVLKPELDEMQLALELRRLSPTATPNPHIIALADGILGRGGRMIAAIKSIGRGAECFEGVEFGFEVE